MADEHNMPEPPPSPEEATAAGEAHAAEEAREPERPRSPYRGTGILPALIAGIVIAAAIVAFIAQNGDSIDLEWLWLDFETSPAVLVLVTVLLAVVADEVLGLVWRRARRRRLSERDEVERLRSAGPTGDTA